MKTASRCAIALMLGLSLLAGTAPARAADGNLLRKVEMSSGRLIPTEYVITAKAEACIEP